MAVLESGTRLDHYEIVGPVAAGGMGEVYRARDPRLDRQVAIKILPATFVADAERLARFEREARAVAQINHPNVLAVYDVGRHGDAPYIVTELLEGETLRERMTGKPMPPQKVARLGAGIAAGLAAAHEVGIVHRDLKPANVFITRDGRVKLLDFGLAKAWVRPERAGTHPTEEPGLTASGMIIGTEGYMSPEQVRGVRADARSDIFNLGVILLEMLTGRAGFVRDTFADSLSAVLNEEPAGLDLLDATAPPFLARVVRLCLEKRPEARFQAARDVAFALDEIAGGPSSLTGTPSGFRPGLPPRPTRPGLAWIALAAAGLLAVGAVAGMMLAGWGRGPAAPRYEQLTFRRGTVWSARFAADGSAVVYGARWDGAPLDVFLAQPGNPEARPLGLAGAEVLAVSRRGEMLVSRNRRYLGVWVQSGTLARAPLGGGQPRDLADDVEWADWGAGGDAVAAVRSRSGKSVLEYPLGTVLYETAGWISHARVSPDGHAVAFLDHPVWLDDGGAVTVVDRTGARRVLDPDCTSLQGLAWSPRGDEVWYSAGKDSAKRSIWAVRPGRRPRAVLAPAVSVTLHDIAADGRLLVAFEDFRVGIAALAPGESQERDLSWLDYSVVRDVSGDGRTVLFTEGGRGGGPGYGVYLRSTDASPALRLGDGDGVALSPDGRWVLAAPSRSPRQLLLLPTGAGATRAVTADGINHLRAKFLPGGDRIVFVGSEPGRANRLYVQPLRGGRPWAISPEGIAPEIAVAPDGGSVAVAEADGRISLYPVERGAPRRLAAVPSGLLPAGFSRDGGTLFLAETAAVPAALHGYDLGSGRVSQVRTLAPRDLAGLVRVRGVSVAADGAAYAYSYFRVLNELLVVTGVR